MKKAVSVAVAMMVIGYAVNSWAAPDAGAPAMKAAPMAAVAAKPAPAMTAMAPTMTAPKMPAMAPAAMAVMAPKGPAMAAAPPKAAAKDSVKKVVIGGVLEIILYVVGALLAAILPILTGWMLKKMKVESAAAKDAVDTIVSKAAEIGMHYAEEKARTLSDNPEKGAEKMKAAVEAANKYLRDSKLPEKGADYLAMLIAAKLGEKRNGEAGK